MTDETVTEPTPSEKALPNGPGVSVVEELKRQAQERSQEQEQPDPAPVEEPSAPEADEPADAAGDEEQDDSAEVKAPDKESDDDEAETIASMSELIEQQEWDPEWFESLTVPVKVDGKPAEATIAEMVASYQTQEAADQRLSEATAKAKSITKDLADRTQALEGQFVVASKLIETLKSQLDVDASAIDWNTLRNDDPAEYSARKAEISERRQNIDAIEREAVESYQQAVKEQREQQVKAFDEYRDEQQELLLEKLPAWRDKKVAEEEQKELAKYLLREGFSKQEVQVASDHRLFLLAHKARRFDESQKKIATAKKRVARVPKVLTPGARPPETSKPKPTTTASILYPNG